MKRKISHTRLNPSLLFVSKGHGIKAHDIHWAHASRATINEKDEKDEKNFYHSVPKHVGEEKKKKKLQAAFTCSKSIKQTPEQCAKSVQSYCIYGKL